MMHAVTATILLDAPWEMDVEKIADAVEQDYPEIGLIDGVASPDHADSAILMMDGAQVVLQTKAERLPPEAFETPMPVTRTWDPTDAIARHRAHITVSCGGQRKGSADIYASATHLVTATLARLVPAVAIQWGPSLTVTPPAAFTATVDALLEGSIPLDIWISFAPVVPEGYSAEIAAGMATLGVRPFLGRELELSPRPGTQTEARDCLASVARRLLEQGASLRDGQRLEEVENLLCATVRRRDYWLRRDRSAFVLVTDDAIIEQTSHRATRRNAA